MKQFFFAALFSLGLATNTFGALLIEGIVVTGLFYAPTDNSLGPVSGLPKVTPIVPNGVSTTVSWGADMPLGAPGFGAQSSYVFDNWQKYPGPGDIPPAIEILPPSVTPFYLLGNFTHNNWIVDSPILTSVKLDVGLGNFTIGGANAGSPTFTYLLTHLETDNFTENAAGTNCLFVPTPDGQLCRDKVTITAPVPQTFNVGGVEYTLELAFRVNDITVSEFITSENQANQAEIVGRFTAKESRGGDEVPEPSTIALMGVGLLGLTLAAKRRKS